MNTHEFTVVWEIQVQASSPQEAAEIAMDIQRDKNSIATVFDIIDMDGEHYDIDIEAIK